MLVEETKLKVEKNLSGDLDELNQSNVLAEACPGTLAKRHSIAVELVSLVGVHPALRFELQCVLTPELGVGMDAPSTHANSCILGEELAADSATTSRNSTGKAEPSGRVEAKGFLDNSSEERNLRKLFPCGVGSIKLEERIHELLVDGWGAAKIDDDIAETNRCSVRCSQTKSGQYSFARGKMAEVCIHENISMISDFTEGKLMSILIPGIEKPLEKIVAATEVSLVDTFLDLTLDASSVMLHSGFLDDVHLGNRPDPREVRPVKISIRRRGQKRRKIKNSQERAQIKHLPEIAETTVNISSSFAETERFTKNEVGDHIISKIFAPHSKIAFLAGLGKVLVESGDEVFDDRIKVPLVLESGGHAVILGNSATASGMSLDITLDSQIKESIRESDIVPSERDED